MSVQKSDIVTFVNEKQRLSETVSTIEDEINEILQDLGKRALWPDLYRSDVTADRTTLSSGDTEIAFPSGLRVLDFVVINDGTNDGEPLHEMTTRDWHRQREDESTSNFDEPLRFTRRGKSWLPDPIPDDQGFTAKYWYWRHHPKTSGATEDILFGDEFDLCVKYGVCLKVALTARRSEYVAAWQPRYENQVQAILPTADKKKTVCRYRDV